MKIYLLTLFKDMLEASLNSSILKRAIDNGIIEVEVIDIRDFSDNNHKRVDDYPYGGGAGMVMAAEPIMRAFESIEDRLSENTLKLYTSPRGELFNKNIAFDFSQREEIVILCGHYEGVDERVLKRLDFKEVSVGDYILTGGELPALIIIDALSRYVEGVLGNYESALNESLDENLLEYPQYTRPSVWRGESVPEVLLSGNHAMVDKHRLDESIRLTNVNRPDLIEKNRIFDRIKYALGDSSLEVLKSKKVAVFGLGGVGGMTAEVLVRSGVGAIDLIDKDVVDITNFNRQILANDKSLGKLKVEVATDRFYSINNNVRLKSYPMFYNEETKNDIDLSKYDYVIDAIDTVTSKLLLISECKKLDVPIISSMGTGFRMDPTKLVVNDIFNTKNCPLAKVMRKGLRQRGIKALKCVYSTEDRLTYHKDYKDKMARENGKSMVASMMFVPAAAGILIAKTVISDLLENNL